RVLGYLHDYALAADTAIKVADDKVLSGRNLYEMAVVCALAASSAKTDSKLTPTERIRRSDQFAGSAVAILQKARAADFFHFTWPERPQKDEAWAVLRARADYQELMAELTKRKR